jgi:hypothetical protein
MKLTKSEYLMYLDCPKHLWAYVNNKLSQNELDTFTQHLFEQGYEVQKYAKEFVKNILVPNSYANTKEYYFEVTKSDGNFEVRIDLIIFNDKNKKWDIYEIKSTNDIKPIHKKDLTFQYLVLSKHYDIDKCFVLHLNKEYERRAELSLKDLFTCTDITEDVHKLVEVVNMERFEALEIVKNPKQEEIEACMKPKKCPCIELCHPELPPYSIYEIARITASKEKVRYIETNYSKSILDVPSDATLGKKYSLSVIQRKQVDVAISGTPIIDIPDVTSSLECLKYPLYFIDYESFNPAIPMYEKYKPYDQMPFQYSLHIQESQDAEYQHKEFIETSRVDPSKGFLKSLKDDIGESGSVIIWSKFEQTQNNALKRRNPDYLSLIDNVNSRLWDLMEIFQKMMYVLPQFKGSYSIKKVLPALVPELTYKSMAISDGSMAMTKWVQMVYGGGITALQFPDSDESFDVEPVDIPTKKVNEEEIKENLLRYCELDTWAMVKILEKVKLEIAKLSGLNK